MSAESFRAIAWREHPMCGKSRGVSAEVQTNRNQLFASAPGVFLVGSGLSGFEAPVFFLGSGTGATKIGAYALYGMTTDGK